MSTVKVTGTVHCFLKVQTYHKNQVASVDTDSKPKDASEDSDVLGLLRHLLPTPAVSPPQATSIPTDRELLLQCLLGQ